MKDAGGIAWTHVIRWWDDEYGKAEAEVDYYITDNYDISSSEIELNFGVWDKEHWEMLAIIPNIFNYDDYLSDDVIFSLKNKEFILDKDVARWNVAYVKELYDRFYMDKEKREDYKKSVLKSVLKYMDLRRQNPMTQQVVDEIFSMFYIRRNENLNLRKQIELILKPKDNDYILNQLAQKDSKETLRLHLDKIGEAYRIYEEKSQYRIGVLFIKFFDTQTTWLSPSFIYSKSEKKIKNYSKYMKLMASYYGIDPPTYREGILRKHKEQGEERTLISTIRHEDNHVWISIGSV